MSKIGCKPKNDDIGHRFCGCGVKRNGRTKVMCRLSEFRTCGLLYAVCQNEQGTQGYVPQQHSHDLYIPAHGQQGRSSAAGKKINRIFCLTTIRESFISKGSRFPFLKYKSIPALLGTMTCVITFKQISNALAILYKEA